MFVFLNKKIIDEKDAKISIHDHGFLYGDAVFETIRFDNNIIENYDHHIKRLKNSAKTMYIKIPDIDFKKIIEKLVNKNKLNKARIRITISRGENSYKFTNSKNPTTLITTIRLKENTKWYKNGSKTCSIKLERLLPQVKSIQLLPNILAYQKMEKENCDECFFVNSKKEITEGSKSNFFAIKNNTVYTPPLKNCLEGTIRKNIISICKKYKIKYKEQSIKYSELSSFKEAFWTNSPSKIVPIKTLDKFNFKAKGHITQKLIELLK